MFYPMRKGPQIPQFCDPECCFLLHVWPLVVQKLLSPDTFVFLCAVPYLIVIMFFETCSRFRYMPLFTEKLQKSPRVEIQREIVKHS